VIGLIDKAASEITLGSTGGFAKEERAASILPFANGAAHLSRSLKGDFHRI
jgi:hypothetical protein